MEYHRLGELIRTIPDFPKPGILFRDITTLLLHPTGFKQAIDLLVAKYEQTKLTKIAAIESRGFAIGGAMAYHLNCGLVLVRKRGKLPGAVEREEYALEYGTDCVEIHRDAISPGDRVLVVDDLIATGGTAAATVNLIKKLGGEVAGAAFIINLPDLGGHTKMGETEYTWLVEFEGE